MTTRRLFFFVFSLVNPISLYATSLTPLEFWFYERLENEELRGGTVLQLNTKPFDFSVLSGHPANSQSGFVLESMGGEYTFATQAPKIQQREGIWTGKGQNLVFRSRMGWVSEHASLWVEPVVAWHENRSLDDHPEGRPQPVTRGSYRYPKPDGSYTMLSANSAFALIPFSNWYLFLGTDNLRFGGGKHDSLHLSNSAEPFPMIRIGTKTPWQTRLGAFSFISYIGEMEADRHIPRAKLSGWRLNWNSEKRVEFGISRAWFVGGEGQKNDFSHVVGDLYLEFFKPRSGSERLSDFRNQQIVMDFRVKIPEMQLVLYGEWGREDHQHGFDDTIEYWDSTQGYIAGVKGIDIFARGYFWILEYANNSQPSRYPSNAPWYNHHEYKSGWTYKGINLGHHMGSDSSDTFIGFGREQLPTSWMIYVDQEVHGIRTRGPGNRETRLELGTKGYYSFLSNIRLGYEMVVEATENYGLVRGNNLSSAMAGISLLLTY